MHIRSPSGTVPFGMDLVEHYTLQAICY